MHLGGAIINLDDEKYQRLSRTLEPNMLFYFTINDSRLKRDEIYMIFCVENLKCSFSLSVSQSLIRTALQFSW